MSDEDKKKDDRSSSLNEERGSNSRDWGREVKQDITRSHGNQPPPKPRKGEEQ